MAGRLSLPIIQISGEPYYVHQCSIGSVIDKKTKGIEQKDLEKIDAYMNIQYMKKLPLKISVETISYPDGKIIKMNDHMQKYITGSSTI